MVDKEMINRINILLGELCEDNAVPRNVKAKFQKIIVLLKEPSTLSMKINQALHELDDVNDDTNLEPYIRTQIWNVSSMLEKVVSP
jgi:uncharacterized protein (UPF0147 family)